MAPFAVVWIVTLVPLYQAGNVMKNISLYFYTNSKENSFYDRPQCRTISDSYYFVI